VSFTVFRTHLLASYFKLIVLLHPPLYYNNSTGFESKKINFKLATLTYKGWPLDPQLICLPYLHRTILSFDQLLLQRFPTKSNFSCRGFCFAAPSVWNSLPYPVKAFPALSSFKRALKTHYLHRFRDFAPQKKLIKTHHEMRIPDCDVTYIVLSVYLLTLIHRQPLKWNQHRYHTELELDFAEYIQHTDVRIVDLCWAPIPFTG